MLNSKITDRFLPSAASNIQQHEPQVLQAQYLDGGGGHHQVLQGSAGCGIRQVPAARLWCKWSMLFNR